MKKEYSKPELEIVCFSEEIMENIEPVSEETDPWALGGE